MPGKKELFWTFCLFLASSLIVLYFGCVQSPFYRFSYFQDSNVYMSIARAMQNGLLPYRDVFDHKGILLYLINYLAATAFPKSMIGIYLILSISLAGFLFYGYRISRLFFPVASSLVVSFAMLFILKGIPMYAHGGKSTEEYFMPCLMGFLFYLIESCRHIDNKQDVTTRRFVIGSVAMGFFCGVMLWIKYTLVPAIGLTLLFFFIANAVKNRVRKALESMLGVVAGLLIVSLPCLFFLMRTQLLEEMFSIYVLFNYHYATDAGAGLAGGITENLDLYIYAGLLPNICVVLGLLLLRSRKKLISALNVWCIVVCLAMIHLTAIINGRYYIHYFLPIVPFLIFTVIALIHYVRTHLSQRKKFRVSGKAKTIVLACVISMVLLSAFYSSRSAWRLGAVVAPKTDIEYCADAINDHWIRNGNGTPPRIISFHGIEVGLMQLCDTYPQNKYFYFPTITGEKETEILLEQIQYILEGSVDFVCVRTDIYAIDISREINSDYRLIYARKNTLGREDSFYCIYAKFADTH
ncbi:MAG: hypothetical protein JW780_06120 [Clostridiales bacterium]|nr:hypothetical protein [Clostridiales bacterium]